VKGFRTRRRIGDIVLTLEIIGSKSERKSRILGGYIMVHWCFGLEAYDFFLATEPYNENYPKRRGKVNESFFSWRKQQFRDIRYTQPGLFCWEIIGGLPQFRWPAESSFGFERVTQSALDQDSSILWTFFRYTNPLHPLYSIFPYIYIYHKKSTKCS